MSEIVPLEGVRLGLASCDPAELWAVTCTDTLNRLGAARVNVCAPRSSRPDRARDRDNVLIAGLAGSVGVRSDPPPLAAGRIAPAMLVGAHAALAGLAALRVAEARRQRIVVSLDATEVIATCSGDALPQIVCPGLAQTASIESAILECADGFIAVGQLSDRCRTDIAFMAGRDSPTKAGADIAAVLAPWLRRLTRQEATEIAMLWRLPFTPVLRRDEALAAAATEEFGAPFEFSSAATAPGACGPEPGAGPLPLSGVVALDLGVAWSGPYCAALLHALGARVIRVTRPSYGTRQRGSESSCGGVNSDLHAGKELVELDLSTGPGRDELLALVRESDLLIQNFSPRVMANLRLEPAELRRTNPAVITIAMPAFGPTSPWSRHIAYGSGLECATGLAVFEHGLPPRPARVPYLDYLAGCFAAISALSLLRRRDRSGVSGDVIVAQQAIAALVFRVAHAVAEEVRYRPEEVLTSIAIDSVDSRLDSRTDTPHRHRSRPPWSFTADDAMVQLD